MGIPQEDRQARESGFRSKVAELLEKQAVSKKTRTMQILAANLDLLEGLQTQITDNLPPMVVAMVRNMFKFDLEADLAKVPFGMIAKCSDEQFEFIFAQIVAAVEDIAKYGAGESSSGA